MMEVEAASKRKFTRNRNDRETVEEMREKEHILIRLNTLEDYEVEMQDNDGNSPTFLEQLLISDDAAAAATQAQLNEA